MEQQTIHAAARPQSIRDRNARILLSTVRAAGEIASADIARACGFSAQTASVITRALESDGLLERGAPRKGKVGKPVTPLRLSPDGAFSFGLRIGRRSADLVLVDLIGRRRGSLRQSYAYPVPEVICDFVQAGIEDLGSELRRRDRDRVVGIGVAAPFELWNWNDQLDAPDALLRSWAAFDFARDFATFTDLPVQLFNDATMACAGELIFGNSRSLSDFAYFHVGSFIGGGLVMNGKIIFGQTGNAGAFGSMQTTDGAQLLDRASLYLLERRIEAQGGTARGLYDDAGIWDRHADLAEDWIDATARHIARAIVTVTAVTDVTDSVINGQLPDDIRTRLADRVRAALGDIDTRGIRQPSVWPSDLDHIAGALGAAYQPILNAYLLEGSDA